MASEEAGRAPGDAGDDRSGGSAVAWLVAGVVVLLGLGLMLTGDDVAPPISRGDSAPDFSHPRLSDGRTMSLGDLRGKVALVNFWATWCKPCEEEMPAMEQLYLELAPEGFEMVAISVDEKREDVEAFQARMQISFPILLDPAQESSRAYQTMGYPESLLLDPEGRIIERYVGPRDWAHPDYVDRVRRLIASSR